jgi:AraC-like DNA-binding protein
MSNIPANAPMYTEERTIARSKFYTIDALDIYFFNMQMLPVSDGRASIYLALWLFQAHSGDSDAAAFYLGFYDASNFRRSFNRWTGRVRRRYGRRGRACCIRHDYWDGPINYLASYRSTVAPRSAITRGRYCYCTTFSAALAASAYFLSSAVRPQMS